MKNINISDKTSRQLTLIGEKIELYKQRKLSLLSLYQDLISILHAIEDLSPEWKEEFLINCNELDVAYAVSKEMNIPLADFDKPIDSALYQIKLLVEL